MGETGLLAVPGVIHRVLVVASVQKAYCSIREENTRKTAFAATARFCPKGQRLAHLSFASRKALAKGLYLILRAVI